MSGRLRLQSFPTPFHAPTWAHVTSSVSSIEKREGGGGGCPAGTGGGRDIYARQQKSEEGDAIPDLLLKHQNATLATYVEGR
jgi:hypothetical protein